MQAKTLSVIIPVYNEGNMIKQSILRVNRVLSEAKIPHEIILIDDGSKDHSWLEMEKSAQSISQVKAIKLSRNFGKESALCAGLDLAKGECCVCIDADMQHPPEVIPSMYNLWCNEGYDVVEGIKKSRGKESLGYKISAGLFTKYFTEHRGSI